MSRDQSGFSLIEALVAMAILAGAASTALMVVSSSADRNARATAQLRATFAAEALLNRVGLDIDLRPQNLLGTLRDGSRWSVEIRPYAEDGFLAEGVSRLLRIEARVTPREPRYPPVRLITLRPASLRP